MDCSSQPCATQVPARPGNSLPHGQVRIECLHLTLQPAIKIFLKYMDAMPFGSSPALGADLTLCNIDQSAYYVTINLNDCQPLLLHGHPPLPLPAERGCHGVQVAQLLSIHINYPLALMVCPILLVCLAVRFLEKGLRAVSLMVLSALSVHIIAPL